MWFEWDPEAGLVRLTHTTSRKNYKNIQRDSRVSLLVWDPNDPYRYIQIRGHVENIDRDETGSFHQRLQRRYRGEVSEVLDRAVRVVVNIRPDAYKIRGGAGEDSIKRN